MATEKRLIAFDPITFESFTRHCTKHREPYDQYDMGYTDAVDNIEAWLDENKVDAMEVKHGRWEDNHCTACGMMPMGEELWEHLVDCLPPRMERFMDYCPNCGAKMDGGADNGL